jgi:signal transduction histidine kinase
VNVEDDGRGFNPREPGKNQQDQSGFGLKGIAERVKILRGEFSMHSSPGSGTKLTIEIPVGDTNTGSDK